MAHGCNRLDDLAVSSYLDDPSAERWRAMRAHVEACDDCRAQIETIRQLRDSFASESESHLGEDLLVRYADERASLQSSVADEIGRHLAACASCRDELAVLSTITIVPASAPKTAAEPIGAGIWQRVIAALRGPGWQPLRAAAAFALLVAVTLPFLRGGLRPVAMRERSEDLVASTDSRSELSSEMSRALAEHQDAYLEPLTMGRGNATSTSRPEHAAAAAESNASVAVRAPEPAMENTETQRFTEPRPLAPASPDATAAPAKRATHAEVAAADARFARREMPAAQQELARGSIAAALAGVQADGPAADLDDAAASDGVVIARYVPSGRIVVPSSNVGSLRISMYLVRASTVETREPDAGAAEREVLDAVAVAQSVRHLVLRVTTTADGAEPYIFDLDPQMLPSDESKTLTIAIPRERLGRGENRFELVDGDDGSAVAPPFLIEIE